MNKFIPVIILIILFPSCSKSESDFIWEKSFGKGKALYASQSADSGFAACGEAGGKPFFVRLKKTRSQVIDISADYQGNFSSFWFDNSGYIMGGSSSGKMLVMRFSPEGSLLWEKTLDGGFNIDFTNLHYEGNGNMMAIGTASPDSSASGPTGLLFFRFDTTGNIITEMKVTGNYFIAAKETHIDNSGNIYLAMTSKTEFARTKASVAKYNEQFQKLWETDLSNNPDYGAASLSLLVDASGTIYTGGRTELLTDGEVKNHSFVASLNNSGSVKWKKYLEKNNSSEAMILSGSGELMVLNERCFFVNIMDPDVGAENGRIRMFSMCDPMNTGAFGSDFDLRYDNNFLVAGSNGGSFYLAIKASQ